MAIKIDVKPSMLESAYVEEPFDEAKTELESVGYDIISLKQFADLRIAQGKDSHVSKSGAYIREGFLYVPQKGIFLVRTSPILANAKEAINCHQRNREFYLTQEEIEEALEDSVQFRNSYSIPTERFGEDERTVFAFGESAKDYGDFLKDANISRMPIYLASAGSKPFARQARLTGLCVSSRSGLSGKDWPLYCSIAVRGVRTIGGKQ